MKIDLHSHTTFSDGHLTPTELIQRAQTMQVDVLAITDHDTTDGLAVAREVASEQFPALHLIDGVEISTRWQSFEIHIVGLAIDKQHPQLQAFLKQQQQKREERAVKIAEKLAKCGFEGVLERARRYAGDGQITRAHFARVLVNNYQVSSFEKAFKLYLGKGKRAAVKAEWPAMAEAIGVIQQAGGRAVLAHPIHYDMTAKWLRRLVAEFSAEGGDGIEVVFPGINADKQTFVQSLAKEHNLLASAGSDFHFPGRWTELGRCGLASDVLTPVWHDWDLNVANSSIKEPV
ncbi:PHP domain-containing protein [Alteromonas gilva]|uniref:PHP domain-containing protein n=1 Tax=Alteromonas gilva TaxID=2987522 RepID=A0ABT5L3X4_9ALTE|nr:PHP domain-containing protein [Alteromonas gilva]MDC8831735.1 PHP domain-containing protein [Alteromonas gilva]